MNKKFFNLCLYNLKKLNLYLLLFFIFLICITSIYTAINYNATFIEEFNMIDFYCIIFVSSILQINLIFIYNLTFIFSCFENNKESINIKIRCNNLKSWFFSKILTIFIVNIISISLLTIIILFIGGFFWGFEFSWSSVTISENITYAKFYSPLEIIFINIITYSFFVTFLSEIIGFLIIKLDKKIFVSFLAVLYLVINRLKFFKYFSFENYMSLDFRNYYKNMNPNNYITIKEGIIFPIILFISTLLILNFFYSKNLNRGYKYERK